jgi:hypothetical protein
MKQLHCRAASSLMNTGGDCDPNVLNAMVLSIKGRKGI